MPVYEWTARSQTGDSASGEMDAASEYAVVDTLKSQGLSPVLIKLRQQEKTKSIKEALASLRAAPVDFDDILLFSRQMYTLNKAGVPILRAFAGLQASAEKSSMAAMLADIRAGLDQGKELSSALSKHVKLFGSFYISMMRVGEMTGRMTEVFLRLTDHMEFERAVKERIKQAMRYPTFVLGAMSIAIVILNIFVIPVFAKVFAGFKSELPVITRGLLAFSGWMVNWWPLLLIGTGALWYVVKQYLATDAGRYKWDRMKLSLPVIGPIVLKATLARFARSFALASESGVPLVQALTVVSQTVDNAYIGKRIEQMRDGIERGETISRCAATTGVFTPVVLQMISVGEETGELDALLFEIAAMYERDTDYAIKGISAAIEPIMLGIVAVLVLLLALGVFLPLWNMGQAAMGKGTAS
jgi:MSHA biogenesis protein MshG